MVKGDENGVQPTGDLILFYHKEFVEALKLFGYTKPPPSLVDLNVELLRHGAISALLCICFVPFNFVDWSNIKVEDMVGDVGVTSKSFRKSMYEHPICKMLIQTEMKTWVHKGWL